MDLPKACFQAIYHAAVVGPAAEFHLALLVVEREPSDVNLASTLEDAGRDVGAATVVADDGVGLESVVESFVGTALRDHNNTLH